MRVKLTIAARKDLVEIVKWIAQDNPERAKSFGKEMLRACHTLSDFPEAFPIVSEKFDGHIRRKVHGNYLIFYHISGKSVEILHVVSGSRDWEVLFS